MKYAPYKYQSVAVDDAVQFLRSAEPGAKRLYAAPTGCGKSVIELMVQRAMGDGCWIVTPRDEIAAGMLDKLEAPDGADMLDYRIATPVRFRNRLVSGELRHPAQLVFDESHHHEASVWQQLDLLSGLAPAVGYTATPYRGSPRSTRSFLEAWGDPVWILTYQEAAAAGYISLPTFEVLPLVDDDIVEVHGGDFEVTSLEGATVDRLGDCIAEGTPVLTDHGWKPVEAVTVADRVWDGCEWVECAGSVCKGMRECIQVQGVYMTPDHLVLTEAGWREARCIWNRRTDAGQSLDQPGAKSCAGASADTRSLCSCTICYRASRQNARIVPTAFTVHVRRGEPFTRYVRQPGMLGTGATTEVTGGMEGAVYVVRSLRLKHSKSICSRYLAGIRHGSLSTGLTTTETTHQATCAGLRMVRTLLIDSTSSTTSRNISERRWQSLQTEASSTGTSQVYTANQSRWYGAVYDVIDAGPRHRFQAGPLIVHNCADHARQWYRGRWDRPTVFALPGSESCRRFQHELNSRGLPAVSVSASTARFERAGIFRAVTEGIVALLHINIVSEGIDLPLRRFVDLSPTMSPVNWVQKLGRITRPVRDGEPPPEYICTNRNTFRHAYALEGCVPLSAIVDTEKAFGPTQRAHSRVLGLEAIGRFKPVAVKLLSGPNAYVYALSTLANGIVVEYCCLVHPTMEPVWAAKVNTVGEDGKRKYGSWAQCEPPLDLRGFSSVGPRELTEKQMRWWDRAAHRHGLDPQQDVNKKSFQALPVLSDLGVRLT